MMARCTWVQGWFVVMAEQQLNRALVTKTLVFNAASAVSGDRRVTLGLFLDLCSLCEATVILDDLRTMESSDALPRSSLTSTLMAEGILSEFRPTVSQRDLQRLLLRLPEALTRRLSVDSYTDDLRDNAILADSGAVEGIRYDVGVTELVTQLDEIVTYPSLRDADIDPRTRMLRSNGYLVEASTNGIDYYPDFDRAPFVNAVLKTLYRSLPRQLYERVAEALGTDSIGKEQLVREWTLDTTLPIPPVTATVLQRSRSRDEIPSRLLEVRGEFENYRRHFREFRGELQAADTLKERRRLHKKYEALLTAASGPDAEIVSAAEMLNFGQNVLKAGLAPTMPTSYSAGLITQPIDWIKRWWQRRPLAILFRLDSKMPRLSEYARLIERLWDEKIQDEIVSDYIAHAAQIRRLMSTPMRS
jgi:hypothetical protein